MNTKHILTRLNIINIMLSNAKIAYGFKDKFIRKNEFFLCQINLSTAKKLKLN